MSAAPNAGAAPGSVHVLIVDDSAVVREVMKEALATDRRIVVTTAPDPIVAMEKMKAHLPDVIVLDLEMPRMDGLTFLQRMSGRQRVPVIVCSSFSQRGAQSAVRALELGAVDVIEKPRLGVRGFLNERRIELLDAVHAAAQARVRAPQSEAPRAPVSKPVVNERRGVLAVSSEPARCVVALGASTGGTEALADILTAMPPDAPPMLIVQHMPEGFTASFAQRLDSLSAIEVREARTGDAVAPGRALIAPGGKHLSLRGAAGRWTVEVSEGPLVSRHRPSVDVLFRSVSMHAKASAVGVLLTGMGADGAEGLLAMRRAGAKTIAQDEATSVVFGMPKEAIVRGAASHVLPLDRIGGAVLQLARALGEHTMPRG